jgi:5-methylcytosine-specific restriction endonuclease McrA
MVKRTGVVLRHPLSPPPRWWDRGSHGHPGQVLLDMLLKQGGCASCGSRTGPWEIDHDHKHCPGATGCPLCVCGILCGRCNHAAGNVGDDPDRLRQLADYLERTRRW